MLSSPVTRLKTEKTPAIVASLKHCRSPLTMVSTYKGMALSQDILLINIIPGRVILQAPQDRMLMALSSSIYLCSQALSETLQAQVLEVKEGRMVLSGLTTTGRPWKERSSERVQPRSPIYVDIHINKVITRACIEDLSTTGMRLSAYKLFERGMTFHCDAVGRLRFHLPDDPLEMMVKAQVVYFKPMGKMVKAGVRIFPSISQAERLKRYIIARKKEILEELDRKCAEIHEPQKVCNLFF